MTAQDNGKFILAGVGIVCITILESVALFKGIDGQLLSVVVGSIGTIVGYAFGHKTSN